MPPGPKIAGALHVAVGALLVLAGAPLLPFVPLVSLLGVWLAVVGIMLFRPGPARHRAAIATGLAVLALAALLAAYGVFAMIMQARSAARGGGLLGGLGEIVLGVAAGLGLLAAADVAYLSRPRVRAAFESPPVSRGR